ncbi:MAG TPA: class I SAM-dependent methyltransferase [Bacteroidia bacterium]
MNCRFCNTELHHKFVDLGNSPPSNSFVTKEYLEQGEMYYPLKVYVCERCFLVQIDECKKSVDIFNNFYPYFSSYSRTWLEHAKAYTEMMIDRFHYNAESFILEIASNDGYLLQYFKEKNIPVMGVEPTANTAEVAIAKGIETVVDFFNENLAHKLAVHNKKADLVLGNNVLAHVPDVNSFVKGLKTVLKEDGVITMEFPHLMQLVEQSQFDTIYHEHFSYFSFYTVRKIFEKHKLEIFDVEQLSTHGGSIRIFAKHQADAKKKVSDNVHRLLATEEKLGMRDLKYYSDFQNKTLVIKYQLLQFLINMKLQGKKVVAYGAAAKGNTLLNYCGIKQDLIQFVIDASPFKLGKYMPASHIPVVKEEEIRKYKPDYVLILPWNIKDEIMKQLSYILEWKGKFVVPIPQLEVI